MQTAPSAWAVFPAEQPFSFPQLCKWVLPERWVWGDGRASGCSVSVIVTEKGQNAGFVLEMLIHAGLWVCVPRAVTEISAEPRGVGHVGAVYTNMLLRVNVQCD